MSLKLIKSLTSLYLKFSAKTYSLNHKSMYKPSAQCGHDDFKDGITNGNKWYKVFNGMQDWNYMYNDCFEVTIELGCCKYPNGESIYSVLRDGYSEGGAANFVKCFGVFRSVVSKFSLVNGCHVSK